MGLTSIENNNQSLQKYEAVLEFISLLKDVVGKDGDVPDNIRKDIEILKSLIISHQKILDENNEIYAKHKRECAEFIAEKKEHLANVESFNADKENIASGFLGREKAVRAREAQSDILSKQHEMLSIDLLNREQQVTRRETTVTDRETEAKRLEKSNTELKSKLDTRYAALTKPLE